MGAERNCKGCQLAKGNAEYPPPQGGIVSLPGGWMLNHYGGPEGFLGWLALQTVEHRISMNELSDKESAALGRNLSAIESLLRETWSKMFTDDPIERLYVAYFLEGSGYHLHLHLIPRTKQMKAVLRAISEHDTVDAWCAPKLSAHSAFPMKYRKTFSGHGALARELMAGIKKLETQERATR